MSDYRIRAARPDEAAIINGHRTAMFLEMGRDADRVRFTEPAVEAWLASHLADGTYVGYFAVTPDDRVVSGAGLAFLDIMPFPGVTTSERGYIYNVYTEPEHRGQGLATRLVQHCLAVCRERGIPLVSLHASSAGRPIYARLGFEPSNEMRLELR